MEELYFLWMVTNRKKKLIGGMISIKVVKSTFLSNMFTLESDKLIWKLSMRIKKERISRQLNELQRRSFEICRSLTGSLGIRRKRMTRLLTF